MLDLVYRTKRQPRLPGGGLVGLALVKRTAPESSDKDMGIFAPATLNGRGDNQADRLNVHVLRSFVYSSEPQFMRVSYHDHQFVSHDRISRPPLIVPLAKPTT